MKTLQVDNQAGLHRLYPISDCIGGILSCHYNARYHTFEPPVLLLLTIITLG